MAITVDISDLTLAFKIKVIWQKRRLSRLVLHLELRYVLLTYRKVAMAIAVDISDLTLTFRIKVIWKKRLLSRLVLQIDVYALNC